MSKSRGNVVNPDDVVKRYGADALRLYEMFMGPLDQVKPWDTDGVSGLHRFLARTWRLCVASDNKSLHHRVVDSPMDKETESLCHQTIRKVSDDIDNLHFNTAISQLMVLLNHLTKLKQVPKSAVLCFTLLLSPFAPHIGEEIWSILGHEQSLAYEKWPVYDVSKCEVKEIKMAIQVLGKLRGTVEIDRDASKDEVIEAALKIPAVTRQIEGRKIRKTIYVPGKIVNFIV